MGNTTPNLGLYKPDTDETGWSSLLNATIDLLDTVLGLNFTTTGDLVNGSDTQVAFRNGNALDFDSGFTYDVVSGSVVLSGSISVGGSLSLGGNAYTLPATDGSADQVLQTDGSGNLSWVDMEGGGVASGAVSKIKSNGVQVGGSDIETLDFSSVFSVSESPDTEINIDIAADGINDTHIDFGTGANQVSAADIPIADAGDIITGTNIETALQENRTAIDLNTTHRSSNGSDHSYINQDVTSGSSPVLDGTNFTGIPQAAITVTAGDSYSNFGDAADDTIDELMAAIDTALGGKENALTDKASLESTLSDVSDLAEADGDIYTGAHDFGGADSLEIPNGTGGTTNATGELYLDTNGDGGTNFNGPVIQIYTGAGNAYLFPVDLPLAASQDNYVLKYDASGKTIQWEAEAGGGASTDWMSIPVQSAKLTGDFITAGAQIDAGNGGWKLLFDASQTESALFQFRMPSNYSSGLAVKLIYSMASATTGKVDMEVEVMAISPGDSADVDTASFDSVNEISGGTTVPGTAGYPAEISITCTNADSLAAGDLVFLRINRDHDDADDTATGDLELLAIQLEWSI